MLQLAMLARIDNMRRDWRAVGGLPALVETEIERVGALATAGSQRKGS
jgi:hypothetical protein